ncbi:MAG: nitrate/nitrite transport system ATP-binding protein [bacterium]|nr:MAG: nitrate/nitrite transport system ATP-binding protein [bacterium]
MVTNDVDEGILLADRIIPLSRGPRATLGPCLPINLPRPRDRKGINHDPRFQELRAQVIGYLLGSVGKSGSPRPRLAPLEAVPAEVFTGAS